MKVIFYMEREGEVFAAFPYEPCDLGGRNMTCYSHFGQHGSVCPEYLRGCRLAPPESYSDLKHELEEIGYELEVLTRMPRGTRQARIRSLTSTMTPKQLVDRLNEAVNGPNIPKLEVHASDFSRRDLRKQVYIGRFVQQDAPVGHPFFSLQPISGTEMGGEYDRSASTWRYDGIPVDFRCDSQPAEFFCKD